MQQQPENKVQCVSEQHTKKEICDFQEVSQVPELGTNAMDECHRNFRGLTGS